MRIGILFISVLIALTAAAMTEHPGVQAAATSSATAGANASTTANAATIENVSISTTVTVGEIMQSVNFRTGPGTAYASIRFLKKGELVDVLAPSGSYWYKVADHTGRTGYVSSLDKYIQISSRPSDSPAEPPDTPGQPSVTPGGAVQGQGQGQIVQSVSFRTGPSTSKQRIRYLKKGEIVTILEQANAYWYYVQDQSGVTGYVSSLDQYIQVTLHTEKPADKTTPGTTIPDITSPDNTGMIVGSVSFRTGPSTSHTRLRYLQKGEQITIIQKVNAYWYEITDQHGVRGYVSTDAKYVETAYSDRHILDQTPSSLLAQKVIDAGMKYLGTPYEFGSDRNTTTTFDCSDFVRQAFRDGIGLILPADSRQQASYVQAHNPVYSDWRDLKPGDLLFFMDYKGTSPTAYADIDKAQQRISHDAIYMGDGLILHTHSVESGGVRIDTLAGSHWEYRFLFGGSAF